MHHHLWDLRNNERRCTNSNKAHPTMLKSRNPLLPALALTLLASTLASPHQATAQIIDKVNKNLYSETANPNADIAAALAQARPDHNPVIPHFGRNSGGA